MEPCSVEELQSIVMSCKSLEEKLAYKARGRPTPSIDLQQSGSSNKKPYVRKFNDKWYNEKDWLCGCPIRNALFCFPCLFFGGEDKWTKSGFTNISQMMKTTKHETSKSHVHNVMSLRMLRPANDIRRHLSAAYGKAIDEYNATVKRNRDILGVIIKCVVLCGKIEIALRGHDETASSENRGCFLEIVDHSADLCEKLRDHLDESTVFKGTSKDIQNDILDCCLEIYKDKIRKEIQEAPFVAIMADETTDVSQQSQLAIVFRYICNDKVVERFWGYFIPEKCNSDEIASILLTELKIVLGDNTEKLIGQTYDGANVMRGKKGGVNFKVKNHYPLAHYVHCYAHQLNLILQNASKICKGSKVFFEQLIALSNLFARSPKRVNVLKNYSNKKVPRPTETRWTSRCKLVAHMYNNLKDVVKALEELYEEADGSNEIQNILNNVSNPNFKYWLDFYNKIMPHAEILFQQMQKRQIDVNTIQININSFKRTIFKARLTLGKHKHSSKALQAEANKVLNTVLEAFEERYKFKGHLSAANLFDQTQYSSYLNDFPDYLIDDVVASYPLVDKKELKFQLGIIYERPDMHFDSLCELRMCILQYNAEDIFSAVLKLINILITIPMTTSEPERCFSTLKRIKDYLRNTMGQERLNALAVVSMDKAFFSQESVLEKIIDLFARSRNRRIDLLYKK